MAAQNSAIRTNHIKAKIDKTQQNSKCRLCGDSDETINHIISWGYSHAILSRIARVFGEKTNNQKIAKSTKILRRLKIVSTF